MRLHKRTSIRALLLALMLVIGPVHAQTVFACTMMDMVMHGDCSSCDHEEDQPCADRGCNTAVNPDGEPCCERSVQLSFDQDALQKTPGAKSAELRADAEWPHTSIASFDLIEPPRVVAALGTVLHLPTPLRAGTNIYLITQRLRI